jgi:hypothetical protein
MRLQSILFPGTTLFKKAFTYKKQTTPPSGGSPERVTVHPHTASRLYLLAALPASCVDLTVATVAYAVFGTINALTLNYLSPRFNYTMANLLMSYPRMHIRTWVLFINPTFINYSLRGFFTNYKKDQTETKTSIEIAGKELYSDYFKTKISNNYREFFATRSGLLSRVKGNFEGRLCARINSLGMVIIAAVESLRHSASLAYNLIKYDLSSDTETNPHYLLSNQYRLIVSLERIWEGVFGVIFNEEYDATSNLVEVPKI